MQTGRDIRSELLSHLPAETDLAGYREQVAKTLQENQRRIRLERVLATAFWIFCAVTAAMYIWFGDTNSQLPRGPFLACIFLILGGVEIVKHYVHSAQVELQKEVKQLQVQVFELQSTVKAK
jgi:hypothetical protein